MQTFLSMTKKDLFRYDIVRRLIRKEINGTQAANLLNLSVRQTKRLKASVAKCGPKGLIHGNRGKASNRRVPQKEKDKIVKLLKRHYYDFKPGFACEKLEENHHISRDPKTIRQIMISEKLWEPKTKKNKETHRAWRQRRSSFGEMQQFDGSYEHWFENRAPECCLLLSVDDATGRITYGMFDYDEGVFPTFDFWRKYIEIHGKPLSIYVDRFSTYKMTQKTAIENHDLKTQFQRAMEELQIEPIFAHSPQAKGRVENYFKTLQDRLIKELRLENILTIEQANNYLMNKFIPKYNAKFGIEPRNNSNLHRKLSGKEEKQLPGILSRQTVRVVQNDFTVSFDNQWYQLLPGQPATVCKRDSVIVEERINGEIFIKLRNKYLNIIPIEKRTYHRNKKSAQWVIAASQHTQPIMA